MIRIFTALADNLPSTIAALAAAWLAWKSAQKADANILLTTVVAAKTDALTIKTDENTELTKATEAKAETIVRKVEVTEKKVDAVGGAVAAVKAEAKVISGHVNSSATASTAKIEALENKVLMLYELLAERKEAAALLAQAKSIEQAIGAEPVRVEVNNHTKQIEKNTANTESNVDTLT